MRKETRQAAKIEISWRTLDDNNFIFSQK